MQLPLAATCLFALAVTGACGPVAPLPSAQPWPAADALFRGDPLWLGSDGAYSTDLGGGRVLWLFGDTGVARDATRSMSNSYFIRNSLAIQTGYDPSRAFIQFYWSEATGQPTSFFPEAGSSWFWPGAAVRVGQGLIIFMQQLYQQSPGPSGFAGSGNRAVFIDNPDDDPTMWQPRDAHLLDPGPQADLGTAAMLSGGMLYVYGNQDGDLHDFIVARFTRADAEAGDLSQGQWYRGGQWAPTTAGPPDTLFTLGPPEASVHYQQDVGEFLLTQTEGYLDTTLALRSAVRPEGPWTAPRTFYRPEESYLNGAFVYAGKGHPELAGADLVVTYFPSLQSGAPLPFPDDFYPRFVKVTF